MGSGARASLLIIACAVLACPARADEAVAVVIDVTGTVETIEYAVRQDGTPGVARRATGALDNLAAGASVLVHEGELVLMYFDSGRQYRYRAPSRLRIESEDPVLLSGDAPEVTGFDTRTDTGINILDYSQGGTVMRSTPPVTEPPQATPRRPAMDPSR